MSADRIKKIIIAAAVVCLVIWLTLMLRALAAAPSVLPNPVVGVGADSAAR